MNIRAEYVKKVAAELGADLCGIAPVDRFTEAPAGYHPNDVLPECKSVVVLACAFLKSTLQAGSSVPYTIVRNEISGIMDRMTIKLSYILESGGNTAIPTGAIGPCNWDYMSGKLRGLISLKHSAVQAGLGQIGKNTLLVNDQYGNMLWLGAVLTSAELEADPVAGYEGCIKECRLCLDSCPVKSLDGISINHQACLNYAFGEEDGNEWRIKCFTCRKICPNCLGVKPCKY